MRFTRPGDEKRSLVIVPPESREEWLLGEDPWAIVTRAMPADEFTSRPEPLPPRAKKVSDTDQPLLPDA